MNGGRPYLVEEDIRSPQAFRLQFAHLNASQTLRQEEKFSKIHVPTDYNPLEYPSAAKAHA